MAGHNRLCHVYGFSPQPSIVMMFLSKIIDKNAGILQIGYLLKGSFDVTIGDEQAVLKEGDSYYAQGVVHGVVALEDGALLDVFTPNVRIS